MIHYHGLPITPATAACAAVKGGHAFVSFRYADQLSLATDVCQSFAVDNGAFSAWKSGNPVTDWSEYYAWVAEIHRTPSFDFAVIPDVIDGDEEANDALLREWPWQARHANVGAPVWHMHESIARLERLAQEWPRVCLGSSGQYATVGNARWWGRMAEAMNAVTDSDGLPVTKLHGGTWGTKFDGDYSAWDSAPAPDWLMGLMLEKAEAVIVWGGNYYALPLSRGWLAWRKPDAPPTMAHLELAWTSYDMNAKMLDHSIAATNAERAGHPTQKPIRVMAWSLEFAPAARTVCDPFMGSGTTGVACAQLGKAFTGIERERKYFDLACERISRAQAQGQLLPPEQKPAAVQEALL